jgi:hypothetical protein
MKTIPIKDVSIPVKGKVVYNKELERLQLKVKDKFYNIVYIDTINAYNKLYSLPKNNKWPPWTEKSFSGSSKPYSVAIYWSPFKEGMKIKANIDKINNLAITNKQLIENDD